MTHAESKFFATQAKVIACLPASNPTIMAKVDIARTSASRHLDYLKDLGLIYISAWERSINGGAPYPVYALGNSPDAMYEKQPKRRYKTTFVSAEDRREHEAEIAAERVKLEARRFADNARFWNFAPRRCLFKRQIPKGATA